MKNQTEGEIIISREYALKRIHFYGLNPRHQILDKEALEKYKEEICASRMTYQLVPPDNHRHNISKKIHPILEGPFYSPPQRRRSHLPPPPVVPVHTTSRKIIVIITTIKCQQKHIFVCPLTWQPWILCPPVFAHRNGGTRSQEAQPKENLGRARHQRLGAWHLRRAVLLLALVGAKDKSNKDIRHGIF